MANPNQQQRQPQRRAARRGSWGKQVWVPLLLAFLTPIVGGLGTLVWVRLSGQSEKADREAGKDGKSDQPGAGRAFHNNLDLVTALAGDLEKTTAGLRPTRRYLDLYDLGNDRGLPQADLDAARAALAELGAWFRPAGSPFQAIDADRLVFGFDLGELKLSDEDWEHLLRGYPYGLDAGQADAPALRDRGRRLVGLAGSKVPCVRATWFFRRLEQARQDGDRALPLPAGPLPAAVLRLAEERGRLNLARAAAELGLSDPQDLRAAIQDDPRLRQKCGLAPLADDGTISRDTWEARPFASSAFQEAAKRLGLGTPVIIQ